MRRNNADRRQAHAATPAAADRFEALINDALTRLANLRSQPPDMADLNRGTKRALDVNLLARAATARGVEAQRLSDTFLVLKHREHRLGYFQNMPWTLSALDRLVTNDKQLTKRILAQHGLPVASGAIVRDVDGALDVFTTLGLPVAVKPIVGSGGKGVTVDIRSEAELRTAAEAALARSSRIIVEESIASIDLRIMVVAGRAVASMLRAPAHVMGDGVSTIGELIDAKNALRAANQYLRHVPINVTDDALARLRRKSLALDSVLPAGRRVFLHYKANLGSGGDSFEIAGLVHPSITRIAEQAAGCFTTARHAGIDLLVERFDVDATEQRVVVCEVNLNNDMPIHMFPLYGKPTDTAGPSIDSHFFADSGRPVRRSWRHGRRLRSSATPVGLSMSEWRTEVLARLGEPARHPIPMPDSVSPKQLDQALLSRALERYGFSRIRFRGQLIHAHVDGQQVVLERSGRSVFISRLAQRDDVLAKLLGEAGIDTCQARRFRADQPERAEAHVQAIPPPWWVETARSGSPRRPILVHDVSGLREAWKHLATAATRLTVASAADGLACVVVLIDGHHAASQVTVSEGFVGPSDETSEGRYGGQTIGYLDCPFPGLEGITRSVWRLVGSPQTLAVHFAARPSARAAPTHSFSVARMDPDPVLAEFAYPTAGDGVDLFETTARAIVAGQRYVLGQGDALRIPAGT